MDVYDKLSSIISTEIKTDGVPNPRCVATLDVARARSLGLSDDDTLYMLDLLDKADSEIGDHRHFLEVVYVGDVRGKLDLASIDRLTITGTIEQSANIHIYTGEIDSDGTVEHGASLRAYRVEIESMARIGRFGGDVPTTTIIAEKQDVVIHDVASDKPLYGLNITAHQGSIKLGDDDVEKNIWVQECTIEAKDDIWIACGAIDSEFTAGDNFHTGMGIEHCTVNAATVEVDTITDQCEVNAATRLLVYNQLNGADAVAVSNSTITMLAGTPNQTIAINGGDVEHTDIQAPDAAVTIEGDMRGNKTQKGSSIASITAESLDGVTVDVSGAVTIVQTINVSTLQAGGPVAVNGVGDFSQRNGANIPASIYGSTITLTEDTATLTAASTIHSCAITSSAKANITVTEGNIEASHTVTGGDITIAKGYLKDGRVSGRKGDETQTACHNFTANGAEAVVLTTTGNVTLSAPMGSSVPAMASDLVILSGEGGSGAITINAAANGLIVDAPGHSLKVTGNVQLMQSTGHEITAIVVDIGGDLMGVANPSDGIPSQVKAESLKAKSASNVNAHTTGDITLDGAPATINLSNASLQSDANITIAGHTSHVTAIAAGTAAVGGIAANSNIHGDRGTTLGATYNTSVLSGEEGSPHAATVTVQHTVAGLNPDPALLAQLGIQPINHVLFLDLEAVQLILPQTVQQMHAAYARIGTLDQPALALVAITQVGGNQHRASLGLENGTVGDIKDFAEIYSGNSLTAASVTGVEAMHVNTMTVTANATANSAVETTTLTASGNVTAQNVEGFRQVFVEGSLGAHHVTGATRLEAGTLAASGTVAPPWVYQH